jgi:hypothetical protein
MADPVLAGERDIRIQMARGRSPLGFTGGFHVSVRPGFTFWALFRIGHIRHSRQACASVPGDWRMNLTFSRLDATFIRRRSTFPFGHSPLNLWITFQINTVFPGQTPQTRGPNWPDAIAILKGSGRVEATLCMRFMTAPARSVMDF